MTLPIREYFLLGQRRLTVDRAVRVLAEECMRRQGFDVTVPPPESPGPFVTSFVFRRYTPVASLADARQYGFHLRPSAQQEIRPSSGGGNADEFSSWSRAAREAYGGSKLSSGNTPYQRGCVGEAQRRLVPDAEAIVSGGMAFSPLVREVNLDPRAQRGPKVKKAKKEFAGCMAQRGYDGIDAPWPDPYPVGDIESGSPSPSEIEMAVAQWRCQQRTEVVEVIHRHEVAYQRAWIEDHAPQFEAIEQELDRLVKNAVEVVSARGESTSAESGSSGGSSG